MNNTQEEILNKMEVKNMKNVKKKKGFTLIELIAVIAILGILAAILVPNIIGYTNKAKVGKAITSAGIMMRAIDAYEADSSELAVASQVVQKTGVVADINFEGTLTLADLITADSNHKIFGPEAPIAICPAEWGGANGSAFKISDIREASLKTKTVVIKNNLVSAVN